MKRIKNPKIVKKCMQIDERCRNWKCGSYNNLSPHHIIPKSQGGPDTLDNLITLCLDCHQKITDNKLDIIEILEHLISSKDFRWGKAYKYWNRIKGSYEERAVETEKLIDEMDSLEWPVKNKYEK